ncbi:hypothetical protein LCGC14_1942960 [marine sediment metagenome]|uniref:Transcription factor zinc-finger domain-containing protein n=1 Tax=marine sediment metagenome TaxID=412755 RepID=A0A0F9FJM9_9ZZZZ
MAHKEELQKQLTNNEYAKRQVCPVCHSGDISWGDRRMEYQDAYCGDCGASWVEFSKVAGYTNLEFPDIGV